MGPLLEMSFNQSHEGETIMNHVNDNAIITERILVSGWLETISPLMISQGEGSDTDSDIVLDGSGKPFIPGTSWVGAVRDHFQRRIDDNLLGVFFGDGEDYQSAFIARDLLMCSHVTTEIRTNTKIDPRTKTAQEKSLHNYEVLSAESIFDFEFEVVIRQAHKDQRDNIVKLVKTIISEFQNGQIALGAKTNSGFGKVKLVSPKLIELKFPEDGNWWFTSNRKPTESVIIREDEIFPLETNRAIIKGRFSLDGSIMVRQEYTGDSENIDHEQMSSNGKYIIPGTSLKGVIRHRALKILNTLIPIKSTAMIDDLFGFVNEKNASAGKGRISIGECIIHGGILEKQTRIRVDMFTGGAMDGALFSELPLWDDGNTTIDVDITIKTDKGFDVALILQVLKDLWTGNLTIGGEASIGRGRFKGEMISVSFQQNHATIKADGKGVIIKDDQGLIPQLENAWENIITFQEEAA